MKFLLLLLMVTIYVSNCESFIHMLTHIYYIWTNSTSSNNNSSLVCMCGGWNQTTGRLIVSAEVSDCRQSSSYLSVCGGMKSWSILTIVKVILHYYYYYYLLYDIYLLVVATLVIVIVVAKVREVKNNYKKLILLYSVCRLQWEVSPTYYYWCEKMPMLADMTCCCWWWWWWWWFVEIEVEVNTEVMNEWINWSTNQPASHAHLWYLCLCMVSVVVSCYQWCVRVCVCVWIY